MNRTAEALRREQAEVLASLREDRARQGAVAVLPRPGGAIAMAVYGRVSDKVGTDPTYGPHLLVIRQMWSGTPPTVSDTEGEPVRCYPTPNLTLDDYEVNNYVRIMAARGAMVAETLG